MSVFKPSSPPEILRAAEKDQHFIGKIQNDLSSIARKILGNSVWVKYKGSYKLVAALLYYGLTTLSDNQTLGEEYAGLIQVDKTLRTLPSKTARLIAVLSQVLGPTIVDRLLMKLEITLKNQVYSSYSDQHVRFLLRALSLTRYALRWVDRFHLVLFYLLGKHFRISQRVAGIQFLSVRDFVTTGSQRTTFKIIGTVAIIHLVPSLFLSTKNLFSEEDLPEISDVVTGTNLRKKCSLCLESHKNTSCSPCGHLFCWNCIMQWLQSKPECPLCREPLQPSQVVPLLNYDS